MAKRKVINIDESLCTGCGECATACAEGAIEIKGGKAKVISESFCDGLGACLSGCPTGALSIVEREAEEFDEAAVKRHMQGRSASKLSCPSSGPMVMQAPGTVSGSRRQAQLTNWPIQWPLVRANAPYFKNAHLLLAADCVAFAFANIQEDFIRGKTTVIGCPKLDDQGEFVNKLTEIFRQNDIQDVALVHMEVPCCQNMRNMLSAAIQRSGKEVPVNYYVISRKGELIEGT